MDCQDVLDAGRRLAGSCSLPEDMALTLIYSYLTRSNSKN